MFSVLASHVSGPVVNPRPLRELANPNLHDIPIRLPFRVELWDRHDQHIRWVIAAASSVAVGHAGLDAAIAPYPDQRFTLRNGIQVIREHVPKSAPESMGIANPTFPAP